MSGCVHCVWDAYREEVEEWAGARRGGAPFAGGGGVDEDGGEGGGLGGKDEGYGGMDEGEADLFEGVEVGIREFMRVEKRLRERRGVDG